MKRLPVFVSLIAVLSHDCLVRIAGVLDHAEAALMPIIEINQLVH